jgi:hypothetical protein
MLEMRRGFLDTRNRIFERRIAILDRSNILPDVFASGVPLSFASLSARRVSTQVDGEAARAVSKYSHHTYRLDDLLHEPHYLRGGDRRPPPHLLSIQQASVSWKQSNESGGDTQNESGHLSNRPLYSHEANEQTHANAWNYQVKPPGDTFSDSHIVR